VILTVRRHAEKVGNMFSKTHQGIVKKTVVLEFENGYIITLTAGVEISMHLVMDEAQIKAAEHSVQATGLRFCPACHALLEEHSVYCDTCGTDTPRA
jgi:hypothetical protein